MCNLPILASLQLGPYFHGFVYNFYQYIAQQTNWSDLGMQSHQHIKGGRVEKNTIFQTGGMAKTVNTRPK